MKILFIRTSAFKTPRLIKEIIALKKQGYGIDVLYWNRGIERGKAKIQGLENRIKVYEIRTGRAPYGKGIFGFHFRFLYCFGILGFLLQSRNYSVIHVVDFDSALPVFLYQRFFNRRVKFVYDIADFIESFASPIPNSIRRLIRMISGKIMKASEFIILPDKNRIINIPQNLRNKVYIVNNAPQINLQRVEKLSKCISIQNSKKINVIYYGAFNKDRGIDFLLEISEELHEKIEVFFAGWGELENRIKTYAQKFQNVHYFKNLPQELILAHLKQMDISYIVYSPYYEHNRLASPNKIFEAMATGKPVIVSKGTSIDELVKIYDFGYVVDYRKEDVKRFFERIERTDLKIKEENAKKIYPKFSWEKSERVLKNLYRDMTRKEFELE